MPLSAAARCLARGAASLAALSGAVISTVCLPLLRLAIACLIHSSTFWRNGLAGAYHDTSKLSEAMVRCYRWPAQVRGADRGVANFIVAQIAALVSPRCALLRIAGGGGSGGAEEEDTNKVGLEPTSDAVAAEAPTDSEVVDALLDLRVPVLILHGTNDRIVPLSNSRRLKARLGDLATLLEVPHCGHCPQEETPEVVCEAVSRFISEVSAAAVSRAAPQPD
jgi:pimeloyl-ACP methyl ester carboxylesterase